MEYKSSWSTSVGPHRYCPRCDRAYGLTDPAQIENWAWKKNTSGEWERRK